MSFTPRIDSDFYGNARRFIKGNEGVKPNVYNPGDHVPTLGYGYAMVVRGAGNIWTVDTNILQADFTAIGRTLTQPEMQTLSQIADALNGNNLTLADTLINNLTASFGAISTSQAETLFNRTLDRAVLQVRDRFRSLLGTADGDFLYAELTGSTELIVLADLAFNSPSLIGSGLALALWNDDRTEAWYEIRYNSNSDKQAPNLRDGIANRRYRESDLFNLYNDGPLGEEDYKSAYRTFTRHRAAILSYEQQFSPTSVNAGSMDINGRLASAAEYLLAQYEVTGVPISWENIYVGEDLTTVYYRGTDSDLITGSQYNDLIFGESGTDVLIGNGGSNVLHGGTGLDLYDLTSDTGDYIIDTDGKGALVTGSEDAWN
jgi:RTX calcium-binding nonapeptide repeat (4 copies)